MWSESTYVTDTNQTIVLTIKGIIMNESNLVTNEEQETRNLWGYLNHSKISLKVFVKDILSLFEDNAEVSISLICHCSDDIRYARIISDEYEDDDFFKLTCPQKTGPPKKLV